MFKKKTGYGLLVVLIIALGVLLIISLYAKEPVAIEDLTPAPYSEATLSGVLVNQKINEASGMAASRIHDDVLWILNDSGGAAELYAAGTDGADLGTFVIDGAICRDWEDMASFTLDNTPYLLIAETGDNDSVHEKCILYFVIEPDVKNTQISGAGIIPVEYTMVFQYPEGPRDLESIAVDVAGKSILLLSKRTEPPFLYTLPLDLHAPAGVQIAKKVTAVPVIPPSTISGKKGKKRYTINSAQPVAMDISPDGQYAVVLTYTNAFLFPFDTDWKTTFTHHPQRIRAPLLKQSEAICFMRDGRTIYLTSEKTPTPLYRFSLQE